MPNYPEQHFFGGNKKLETKWVLISWGMVKLWYMKCNGILSQELKNMRAIQRNVGKLTGTDVKKAEQENTYNYNNLSEDNIKRYMNSRLILATNFGSFPAPYNDKTICLFLSKMGQGSNKTKPTKVSKSVLFW